MQKINIKIQKAKKQQILAMAKIAGQCFSGMQEMKKAKLWISSNINGFPRMRYFIATHNKKMLGYILWVEKGGFREKAVFELEQIAVEPKSQGKGVGSKMINESLKKIKIELEKQKREIKIIEITTGSDNQAQKLYQKTLGAKKEAVIKNLFRGDEVIMIARVK